MKASRRIECEFIGKMSVEEYHDAYPIISDDTEDLLFKKFVEDLMADIRNKKLTKMPSVLDRISMYNEKWNSLRRLYFERNVQSIRNAKCLEKDGFIKRIKAAVPEIFS